MTSSPPTSESPTREAHDDAWGRRDALTLLVALVIALVVRVGDPRDFANVGLTHFDEGAYALSARAVATQTFPEQAYPQAHFLSPPVVFGLTGFVMRGLGRTDEIVLRFVVLTFALVGVVVVFVIGRRLAGRRCGFAAATLIALSGFHASLSRIGLTDVPFLTLFLFSLVQWARSERRRSTTSAIGAGLIVGAAWCTKYHGWLALFVALGALLSRIMFPGARPRPSRIEIVASLRRFGVTALTAALVYLPWFLFVTTRDGGYARLTEEHRSFVTGLDSLTRYWRNALVQGDSQLYLDGLLGRLAVAATWWFGAPTSTSPSSRIDRFVITAALAAVGLAFGQAPVMTALALVSIVALWRRGDLTGRVVLIGALGFAVLTPMYFPYARLALPWFGFIALLAAFTITSESSPRPTSRRMMIVASGVALVGFVIALVTWPSTRPARPLAGAYGFRVATKEVVRHLDRTKPVYVLGEPAVVYYLRESGVAANHIDRLASVPTTAKRDSEVQLVVGVYGRKSGEWAASDVGRAVAVRTVARIPVRVSAIRRLDDMRPHQARQLSAEDDRRHDLEVVVIMK